METTKYLSLNFGSINIEFRGTKALVHFDQLESVELEDITPSEVIEDLADLCYAVSPDQKTLEKFLNDIRLHVGAYLFDQELLFKLSNRILEPGAGAKIIPFIRKNRGPAAVN